MRLLYECEEELFCFEIDRENSLLEVSSRATEYKFVSQPWTMLFDKGMEKEQDESTTKLNDKEFELAIDLSMREAGYKKKI